MAKLSEDVKDYIVRELGAYSTAKEISQAILERFGVEVSVKQISDYDPTTARAGKTISAKRRALFEKARKAFIERTDDIPIANRSFRLKRLDRLASKAEERGALTIAASLYEQAAKEVGDVFTNRSKVDMSAKVTHENWLAQLPPPEQPGERTDG